jgi:hypothetical protein
MVCHFKNRQEEVDVCPGIMLSLMPALGALLQGFVVGLPRHSCWTCYT